MTALPGPEKYPEAHALLVLDQQTIRFKPDPVTREAIAEVDTHEQTRLLRGAELRPRSVSYSRSFSKISNLRGRVVQPDGTSREADPSKTQDFPSVGSFELYSDERLMVLSLPQVAAGGLSELSFTETYNDVRPFVFSFVFGAMEPTALAQLVIEVPDAWEIDLIVTGTVSRREEAGVGFKRIILEAKDVDGYRQEPFGPPAHQVMPRAMVRLKSWDSPAGRQNAWATDRELSAWLDAKYRAAGTAPELKGIAAEVVGGLGANPSESDKARALYEYVAKKVEYCAIEIGYGGWIPHPPAEVQKAQYGDCKDKANYLRALLTEAGIESQVALVHSHRGFPNTFVLPSLAVTFNHAILAVKLPEGLVYADPTERTVPFGLLPARDCESPSLLLSERGEALTTTPAFGAERNTEVQQFSLTIDSTGRGSGTFELKATGVNAAELRFDLLRGTGKREERIEKWLELRALDVTGVSKIEAEAFSDHAAVSGQLNAGQLISQVGAGASLVRLLEFAPQWLPSLPPEPRATPFAFRWVDTLTGEFQLTMPAGAKVTAVPAAVRIDNPFFEYQLKWVQGTGMVKVTRQLTRKKRVIPAEQFEAFRSAVEQVHIAENRAAVVRFDGVAR